MSNKPVVFFVSLLLIALVIVVSFQMNANLFKSVSPRQSVAGNSAQGKTDALNIYAGNCARCHGPFGGGMGLNPSLQANGLSIDEIKEIIISGRGSMPPFSRFSQEELQKLSEMVSKL